MTTTFIQIVLLWACGFALGMIAVVIQSRRSHDVACNSKPVRLIVVEIGEDEQIPKGKNGNQTQ